MSTPDVTVTVIFGTKVGARKGRMLNEANKSGGHFHAVRFYNDSDSLCRIVAGFIGEGLGTLQPAVVIATPDHRQRIVDELKQRSFDVTALEANADLIMLDADETMAKFMVDGMPDEAKFRAALIPVIERACRGRACTVRAYGEMVDVLWRAGHTVAATRLEMLWNKLAQTHDFALLCGYSMGNFYKDAAVEDICDHHSHVVSDTGQASLVN